MQRQTKLAQGISHFQSLPVQETLQYFDWFADMRANHPVVYDERMHFWQVFRYDDVNRAITDHATFSSEAVPGFSDSTFLSETIVAKDPPDHRKLRNLVNLAFTPRAVNHLSERIAQIAQELLDAVLPQGRMDVVSDMAFPLPAKAIALLLGVPDEDWDIFRRWARGSEDNQSSQTREQAMRSFQDMQQQMYDYFVDLLAERRRSPRGDLLSDLSVAEIDGVRLSESELVKFCILLLAAGQETTKNLIANALYCFTEYPDICKQLIQNPDLMPSAIEEILRYLPPVWYVFRRTQTAVELGGQRIPANAIIQAWNASANHDASVFADPERIDVQRETNRHLTFGHGIHFCLGAPLARLEARVVLPMMLEQLKQIQRVPNAPITVQAGLVYIIQSLPITFQPRS
ncbi:MAG TPA: cytochrome P450 [Ktedonobacteraceae bacterium]|nr:cytochrome P450 [Ktedonobacteraceae bacterium]